MDRRPPLAVSPRRLRPRPHRAPRPPLVPATSVQTPPGSMKKAVAPMRASICAIPSPIRAEPSPMRASVSALPSSSPLRAGPSPMRASVAALPPATRAKLDFPAGAAEKENIPLPPSPPPSSPAARAASWKANGLPAGAGAHDELVALNLAAVVRAAAPAVGPLFVRGRNYGLYSARRDERLKRKHGFPYAGEWGEEPAASAAVDADAMAEDPCIAVELSKRRVAKKAYVAAGAESVRRSMPAASFGPRSSLRSSKEMKKPSAASGAGASAVSLAVKERRVTSRSASSRRI